MAHRKNKNRVRVDSSAVQGEGSFVIVDRITWGLMQELLPNADKLNEKEIAMQIIPKLVVAWDWVDDDDNPLPQPKDNPEVFDQLNDAEIEFLTGAMNFSGQADLKN